MQNDGKDVIADITPKDGALLEFASQILSKEDQTFDVVDVPEWGGKVRIRGMSGEERDAFEASVVGSNGKMNTQNIRAKLVMLTVVNTKGERVFTKEQIVELGKKSAAALNRVYTASAKLSAISGKDVEELEKNSGADLQGGSSLV